MIFAINKTPNSARKTAAQAVQANCLERNLDNFLANKRACTGGFTLIELLVYIAIMGFIIVVAGRVFSDSTSMRLRSQNMLNSAEEAGRVSALLKEDISQMGAKSWGKSSTSGSDFVVAEEVYINPAATGGDFSSYELVRSGNFDKLVFRKAYFDANGICGAVMEIEWSVKLPDSVLIRKCTTITIQGSKCTGGIFDEEQQCPEEVEMARNVATFQFLPSKPGAAGNSSASGDLPFPASSGSSFGLIPENSSFDLVGDVFTLKGFTQNSSSSGDIRSDFYLAEPSGTVCRPFTFNAGEEYAIDFKLLHQVNASDPCRTASSCTPSTPLTHSARYNKMAMFQPGRDHLSVGLRDPDSKKPIAGIPDFLFYPPQDKSADSLARHFEFSVPSTTPACIGITAAFYSPAAGGHLDIRNFRVSRKTDKVYHFDQSELDYNPTDADKASVKAFELTLEIDKKGEKSEAVTVIPVPNNGVLAGGS